MNGNMTNHPAAMLETEPNEWSTKSCHTKKSITDDATNKGKKITVLACIRMARLFAF
jgi:hypothetical protein